MTEQRGILEFSSQLRAEVIERSHGHWSDVEDTVFGEFKENAFTKVFCEYLSDLGIIEDAQACYFERQTNFGNVKINGYYVDEDRNIVDIFVSLYYHNESLLTITKTEVNQGFERAARLFRLVKKGYHKDMEPASESYDMLQRLYEIQDKIGYIRIFLLTNALVPEGNYEREITKKDAYIFKCQVWDVRRLHRCIASGKPYEAIEIDLKEKFDKAISCLPMPEPTSEYMSYLAVLPGEFLYEIYDEFGSSLLDLNVRCFLQAKGKVNKGIRDTIRTSPERFFAYNNGISTTAESIELESSSNGQISIRKLLGFQVVNGGQTMASIHRAKKVDNADLSKIFVQAKITVVSPDTIGDIVPSITRFANSQNKVNEADFSSNDTYHVEIQRLSENSWVPGEQSRWFYERATGQYQAEKNRIATTPAKKRKFETETPASQKITKTDLARYINVWDNLPHIVSKGPQKNFVDFMVRVRKDYGKDWKPDQEYYKRSIAKAIIYKSADKIIRKIKFSAYMVNVVAYTVAYLSYRVAGRINLNEIWETQRISEGMKEAIYQWSPEIFTKIIESSAGRNVGEWCKKKECWETIRSLSLPFPEKLKNEFKDVAPLLPNVRKTVEDLDALSSQDRGNLDTVMKFDAQTWFEIHSWGIRTGLLTQWECGIAHTLSGYASLGWQKVPSLKQARRGVKIIKTAAQYLELEIS